jgi:O-methyltransferase domain/Dimerisation domain
MMQMLSGMMVAGAVSTLARLGVPDLLEDGPKSAEELAPKVGAQAVPLFRLMRATASVGVLAEGADGKFSQTPLSAVLCTNATPSLRGWATMLSQEWHMRAWGHLEYCVRTGKQALDEIYGKSAFEWIFSNPDAAGIFNQAMTDLSRLDSPGVAEAYSFEGIGTLVDVAGGHGLLLATILGKNPGLKGVLYEIPAVIEGAKTGPLTAVMDRCELVSGDMFTSVPPAADAYIMKHIIHDWPDELCLKILKGCRAGVKPGGKLLVVDDVIPPGNDFHPGKFLDLEMLIFPGGHERTEQQFRDLFAAAGWRMTRVIGTQGGISIVEGVEG